MQDPVFACCVGAHDTARVYDAARAGKNWVLQRGHSIKLYSIKALCYDVYHKKEFYSHTYVYFLRTYLLLIEDDVKLKSNDLSKQTNKQTKQ